LYRRIEEDPNLEAVTVSEALARHPAKPLGSVVPGSWINANFDIWIGAEEDNRAWDLLLAARQAYDENSSSVPEAARALAYEEILIAEGSDWCWWYGPEHHSDNQAEFDQLYRDHLANVYRALDVPIPDALFHPIQHAPPEGDVHTPPEHPLTVTLDGEITSAFEWMGAGQYRPDPHLGAMHGGTPVARELFYGTSNGQLFVRLEGAAAGARFAIEFETGIAITRFAAGRTVELAAELAGSRFRIVAESDGLPPTVLPAHGWIELTRGLLGN
jgi:hypothetical protein